MINVILYTKNTFKMIRREYTSDWETSLYLQLEDEHHLGVGLKDLMKRDETRTMGRGI